MTRRVLLLVLIVVLAACERRSVDHAALRGIVGEQPVVLLSAAWCGYCTKLRGELSALQIPFEELDVESSNAGRQAYELLRARAVPILLVGRDVQHGYSPSATRRALIRNGLLRQT